MTTQQLMEAGRQIDRAFAMLERAGEYSAPASAAVITKRGLLDEARRAVECARTALEC